MLLDTAQSYAAMESNKEEAVRARCIAEKKMQCQDFVGGRKIAIKAQQLFPDLENISQMITICEVHCSAEMKSDGSKDWYGILQVETTADESLIRKQYRKLALLLHPDKNKFPGAEAAFKLVGEAHRTLSDKAKRSVYDMKRKTTIPTTGRRPPSHQPNRSSNAKTESAVPNIYQNNATTPLEQQQTQTAYTAQTFWTSCPFCGTRFLYYWIIMDKALHCQNCLMPFIASDLNAQGAKSTSQQSNTEVSPCLDANGNSSGRRMVPEPSTKEGIKDVFGVGTRNEVTENSKVGNGLRKGRETKVKNADHETMNKMEPVIQSSANSSWKCRAEVVVESSDTDSTDREDTIIEQSKHADALNSEVTRLSQRKSTRQKRKVSYTEGTSTDDDFKNLTKSKHMRRELHTDDQNDKASSDVDVEEVEMPTCVTTISNGKLEDRKRGSISSKDIPNENNLRKKCMEESGDLDVKDVGGGSSKDGVGSISDSNSNKLDSGTLSYPDPEFYNFDVNRDASCFAVGQIWTLYDDLGGMPRFYAVIRNVSSRGFKLRFTWLEYYPIGQAEIDWSDAGLPVGCGNFIHGKTESTKNILKFSHIMPMCKGSKVNRYEIYPRKDEVWALFKDWDVKWSSNPDQPREYKYEFVEIVSDFAPDEGVSAAYLVKVKGFVSLFCPGRREGISTLHIPPNEILRFSHMVPSYRMTGQERKGIPEGFFELDPASLPHNLEETCASMTVDESVFNAEHRVHVNGTECFKSRTVERKFADDLKNDFMFKNIEANEKIGVERHFKSSDISADDLNGPYEKKYSQASGSCLTGTEADTTVSRRHSPKHLENEKENNSDAPGNRVKNVMANDNGSISEPSDPAILEYPDPEFYSFESERLKGKFQTGQIWALFCEDDGFPKYYALIRKVNTDDFKVHITWLEAYPQLEEEIKWSDNELPFACGRFRLCYGINANAEYDTVIVFSHLVQAEPIDKRQYDIYPCAGEVWALFKNWNVEWKASDIESCLDNGEYEMVEVLSRLTSIITVVILEKADGFKSLFRSMRKSGIPFTMEIPQREFLRFSHRIPAFQLTEERGGRLRGYWELDPASVPDILLCTDCD